MRSKIVIMMIALIALTGCESSELYPAGGAIPFSGGNSGGYTAPAQRPLAPVKPMPMLEDQDAENVSEEGEEVWADSEAEAQQRCEQIAQNRTSKDALVTVAGRPQKLNQKGSKWSCRLRVEVLRP